MRARGTKVGVGSSWSYTQRLSKRDETMGLRQIYVKSLLACHVLEPIVCVCGGGGSTMYLTPYMKEEKMTKAFNTSVYFTIEKTH